MLKKRDRAEYYRWYWQENKDQIMAQRRAKKEKEMASRPRCSVCGEPFSQRSLQSKATMAAGCHARCDLKTWKRAWKNL